ncbi:CPBP family intramembrane glutamic endopeptidase [Pedobacter antarcticus]|uniref:CPBP family intramembrane glutamic endopeptidase n=1 Tax=Pedobacter antarcticus TaxID=34086 RepID=UPI00292D085C|nr:CPBP family intramembrane glutamic endopeptidase [Pedobacter antarcticus]
MNFIPDERLEKSPYIQLLMLTSFALLGMVLSSVITVGLLYTLYGGNAFAAMQGGGGELELYIGAIKISQAFTTIFLFLVPPLLLARLEHMKLREFIGMRRPDAGNLLIVAALMACSLPVIEWMAIWNQQMVLPDWLKPLEEWMRAKEDEATRLTLAFLKVNNAGDYLINLVVIALLPAIGEEFLFRGAIQRSFKRMFANPHIAIWVAAFIFSAIHMQFFGFLPRLLLGAMFGYIYWWTGSIWYAVFAHFLNNGYAVTMAWYMQVKHLPIENAENNFNFKWYGYLISLLLTLVCLMVLKNKRTNNGQ